MDRHRTSSWSSLLAEWWGDCLQIKTDSIELIVCPGSQKLIPEPLTKQQISVVCLVISWTLCDLQYHCSMLVMSNHNAGVDLSIKLDCLSSRWPWNAGDWPHIISERSRRHTLWVTTRKLPCVFPSAEFDVTRWTCEINLSDVPLIDSKAACWDAIKCVKHIRYRPFARRALMLRWVLLSIL